MSNPSKKKGTHAEVAAMKWLRDNGFPWCDRQPLRGNRDSGDLQLCIDVIAEVKSVAAGANGQPPRGLLATWLQQTDVETENAGAEFGILIVKRARTANPRRTTSAPSRSSSPSRSPVRRCCRRSTSRSTPTCAAG